MHFFNALNALLKYVSPATLKFSTRIYLTKTNSTSLISVTQHLFSKDFLSEVLVLELTPGCYQPGYPCIIYFEKIMIKGGSN